MEEDVTTDGHVSSRIEGETTCYTRVICSSSSSSLRLFLVNILTPVIGQNSQVRTNVLVFVCVCVWRTERHTSEEETRSLHNATRIHVELFLARLPTAMPAWATGL